MFAEQEVLIRLVIFLVGLIFFWVMGLCFPFRKIDLFQRRLSWFNNLIILFLNAAALRVLAPISLAAIAVYATQNSIGLLHQLNMAAWIEVAVALLLLDLGIYWQHRLMHRIPALWRLHRLHHTDTEFDVTTAGRFHTLEILLSFIFKAGLIIALGVPALAVILFEVSLNFFAMFNHSNISLANIIERPIRLLLVTPDMHRIHHSSKRPETDSNYGFCLSVWDRLFGSYTDQSSEDPKNMEIGLSVFRTEEEQTLKALLYQPFVKT